VNDRLKYGQPIEEYVHMYLNEGGITKLHFEIKASCEDWHQNEI
jgi:hypothetical protein